MSDEIENTVNERPAEEVRGSVNRFPAKKFGTLGEYARKLSGVDTTIYRNVSAAEKSHSYDWMSKQDVKNANERFQENQGLMAELGIDKNKMTRMLADRGVTPDKFGKLHLADQINTANLILKREARSQGYDGTLEVGNLSIDLTEDSVESQAIEMKANGHRNKMSNSKAGLRAGMGVGGTAFTVISPIFGLGGGAMLGYKACTSLFGDNALGKTMGVVAGVFGAAGGAVAAPFVAGWATGKAVEHGENPVKQFMNIFKNPRGIFNKLVDEQEPKNVLDTSNAQPAQASDSPSPSTPQPAQQTVQQGVNNDVATEKYKAKYKGEVAHAATFEQIDELRNIHAQYAGRTNLSEADKALLAGFAAAIDEQATKIGYTPSAAQPGIASSLNADLAKLQTGAENVKNASGQSVDDVLKETRDALANTKAELESFKEQFATLKVQMHEVKEAAIKTQLDMKEQIQTIAQGALAGQTIVHAAEVKQQANNSGFKIDPSKLSLN